MNAIEKIISQMNEAAEQERAALEQEERMKIDQNFEQKRTQVETEMVSGLVRAEESLPDVVKHISEQQDIKNKKKNKSNYSKKNTVS